MKEKKEASAQVHPVIAALEKADEPTTVIRGYRGTSEAGFVRLYPALDTSAYVEIPTDAIVHAEEEKQGSMRIFVRSSGRILSVHRVSARDWLEELPEIRRRETFVTCAAQCEGVFADLAIRIHADEIRALRETDPQRQALLLAQIAQRKHDAKAALHHCLSNCVERFGAPPFMAVPDESAPNGFRVEPFSLPTYFGIVVARHLEKPE